MPILDLSLVQFNDVCQFYSSKFTSTFVIYTFFTQRQPLCVEFGALGLCIFIDLWFRVFGKTCPVTRNPFAILLYMENSWHRHDLTFHEAIKVIYSPLWLECFTFISTESLFIYKQFGSDNYFIKCSRCVFVPVACVQVQHLTAVRHQIFMTRVWYISIW